MGWVKVTGKMIYALEDGMTVPVLEVESMEETAPPVRQKYQEDIFEQRSCPQGEGLGRPEFISPFPPLSQKITHSGRPPGLRLPPSWLITPFIRNFFG